MERRKLTILASAGGPQFGFMRQILRVASHCLRAASSSAQYDSNETTRSNEAAVCPFPPAGLLLRIRNSLPTCSIGIIFALLLGVASVLAAGGGEQCDHGSKAHCLCRLRDCCYDIHYEVDDDEVATVLQLSEHGGEDEGCWVMLEPQSEPDGEEM